MTKPDLFPRLPLFGAIGLMVCALAAATLGRVEGLARAPDAGKPTAERSLLFADRADGAVVVSLADGRTLDVMTGQNGFLRGTLRGFARTRRSEGIGSAPPLTLSGYADGRLMLSDPSTGRHVELEAFGSLNEAVFARLLTMAPSGTTTSAVLERRPG